MFKIYYLEMLLTKKKEKEHQFCILRMLVASDTQLLSKGVVVYLYKREVLLDYNKGTKSDVNL